MKIEQFVHRVMMWVCDFLERKHHYKIPPETRKELEEALRGRMDELMAGEKDG